jgi:uncharacterized membrane protein YdjX (TVP38/TMEM64 family)
LIRTLALILLVTAIVIAFVLLLGTDRGQRLVHDPQAREEINHWVSAHKVLAPGIYLIVFTLGGILALPVWWMEVLSGFLFGLPLGFVYTEIGTTIAAVASAALSRFLLAEWFQTRVESHTKRLAELDERLGHNGLLIVTAVRAAHFLPFGVGNYAFGMTKVSLRDVGAGTFLGCIPPILTYVTVGAAPHLFKDFRYLIGLGAINVMLVAPIILRYLFPDWFKKIGIE